MGGLVHRHNISSGGRHRSIVHRHNISSRGGGIHTDNIIWHRYNISCRGGRVIHMLGHRQCTGATSSAAAGLGADTGV